MPDLTQLQMLIGFSSPIQVGNIIIISTILFVECKCGHLGIPKIYILLIMIWVVPYTEQDILTSMTTTNYLWCS